MDFGSKPDRRCTARRKHGKGPCTRRPIKGGTVCIMHGGKSPQVIRKAQERLADLIDPERMLRTAAALATSDVTDIYNDDYTIKPMREWPMALRQAVKRIEPRLANVDPGDGSADKVLRLELHDKIRPLEMLFKHLGLLEEKLTHQGTVTFKWEGE